MTRTLLSLLVVVGCRSATKHEAEPPPDPIPADARKLEIVYELDLDAALEAKAAALGRDLATALANKKLAAEVHVGMSGLRIAPVDLAQRTAIDELIRTAYATVVAPATCPVSAGPADICLRLAADLATTARKAALAETVAVIRKRLAKARAAEASAVERGGTEIVVRFTANDEQAARIRDVVARRGVLEFKVVDDGAAFMQQLFAYVGSDDDGGPTDLRAQTEGIRAEIDVWRFESGLRTDYYLRAHDREAEVPLARARELGCFVASSSTPDAQVRCQITGRAVLERYIEDLARENPAFRLPDDRQIGFEYVEPDGHDQRPYWRTYYLERDVRISGAMIAAAKGEDDPNTNRPIIMLEFTKAGGQAFGDLTAQITGKKLATLLDGHVKSAPIINGPIRGGRASITMGGSDPQRQRADRDELVKVLGAGSLPVALREASARTLP